MASTVTIYVSSYGRSWHIGAIMKKAELWWWHREVGFVCENPWLRVQDSLEGDYYIFTVAHKGVKLLKHAIIQWAFGECTCSGVRMWAKRQSFWLNIFMNSQGIL